MTPENIRSAAWYLKDTCSRLATAGLVAAALSASFGCGALHRSTAAPTVTIPTAVSASAHSGRAALEDYLRGISHFPQIPAVGPHVTSPGAPMDRGIVNRRRQICHADANSQTSTFEEIAALDPNTASIYPGALVEGKNLLSGRFAEIGLPRGPLKLTVTGLAVSSPNVNLEAPVERPTLGAVQAATNPIVADPTHVAANSLARMSLGIGQVHSFEQALLDAGMSASWLTGDLSTRLKSVTRSKKSSVIIKFSQIYYEVNAPALASQADVFAPEVTLEQVRRVAYSADAASSRPQNPPLYVKTVKYGRMAIIAIASDATEQDLDSAVRSSFNALKANGSMSLDAQSTQVLQQSVFDGVVVGGSGVAGVQLLGALGAGDLNGLKTFMEAGATYHPQGSPAAPISYVLTYLDNDSADSAFAADFSLTGCTDNAVPIERIRVGWNVGDDNKDQEMYPYLILRDRTGRMVANTGGEGRTWASAIVNLFGHPVRANTEWKENQSFGPFEVGVGTWSLDQCDGVKAEVGQRSSNGEDPEWHTTFFVDMRIGGRWYTVRAPSQDTNEFKLGDGKPDSAIVGLSCPPL